LVFFSYDRFNRGAGLLIHPRAAMPIQGRATWRVV
jgi:hypothetical protein